MADYPEEDTFGMSLIELVCDVDGRLAETAEAPLIPTGRDLDLSELSLSTEPCCRLSLRVAAANIAGLAELLDLVVSQEFGKLFQCFIAPHGGKTEIG